MKDLYAGEYVTVSWYEPYGTAYRGCWKVRVAAPSYRDSWDESMVYAEPMDLDAAKELRRELDEAIAAIEADS
jgi:hypothetical protein